MARPLVAAGLWCQVIPTLVGRLDGVALRVPVEDGSLTDLTAVLGRQVTTGDVNKAFRAAAEGPLAGLLRYSNDPLVTWPPSSEHGSDCQKE